MNVERNMKYKIKGILFFVILIGILVLITGCGEEYDQSEKVLNEKNMML